MLSRKDMGSLEQPLWPRNWCRSASQLRRKRTKNHWTNIRTTSHKFMSQPQKTEANSRSSILLINSLIKLELTKLMDWIIIWIKLVHHPKVNTNYSSSKILIMVIRTSIHLLLRWNSKSWVLQWAGWTTSWQNLTAIQLGLNWNYRRWL